MRGIISWRNDSRLTEIGRGRKRGKLMGSCAPLFPGCGFDVTVSHTCCHRCAALSTALLNFGLYFPNLSSNQTFLELTSLGLLNQLEK